MGQSNSMQSMLANKLRGMILESESEGEESHSDEAEDDEHKEARKAFF